MLPFDEWTGLDDAVDLELAQRLADERWPDSGPIAHEGDMSSIVCIEMAVRAETDRWFCHRLPKYKVLPKRWMDCHQGIKHVSPPSDWSEAALRRAYDVIDAEIRAKEPA